MTLPDLAVQTLYVTELNEALDVPVYDQVDVNYRGNYVWINNIISQTGVPESKKTRGFNVSVSLNVVTRFLGNNGGFANAYEMANTITERMLTKTAPYPQPSGFQIITGTLEAINKQTIPSKDGTLFVLNIRILHQIVDKT